MVYDVRVPDDARAHAVAEAFEHLGFDAVATADTVVLDHAGLKPIRVMPGAIEAGGRGPRIVVADGISRAKRAELDAIGCGWLDLTGHLKFTAKGVWIDADVPGVRRTPSSRTLSPLGGGVIAGVSMAALLAWPEPFAGVRAVARQLVASPGGVSLAIKRLIEGGLLTRDHRAVPELFWAIADEWRPDWIEVPASVVTSAVAVGGLAAAKLGAPIATGHDERGEFLVADSAQLKLIALKGQRVVGRPTRVLIAVAPAPIATTETSSVRVAGHPLAHEVVVALTLATDPNRGAEIVRAWNGDTHVW